MAPKCKTDTETGEYCSHGPFHCGPCVPVCKTCGGTDKDKANYYVELCKCNE